MEANDNKPFAIPQVVEWAKSVCDVLTTMHTQAPPIIHRDLKPDNIMLLDDQKSIKITPQVAEALAIDDEELSPPELIRAILRAPVDLLWNGGIGTYVKARDERHAEVSDKPTDAVRIDADDLRCRVVGEGGNLGFTQRARIS